MQTEILIPYNGVTIDHLKELLFKGLGNNPVVYSTISYASALKENDYTLHGTPPFVVMLDDGENFGKTIPEKLLVEYLATIIAMNFCFDIKVFIRFDNGAEMDIILPIFEETQEG